MILCSTCVTKYLPNNPYHIRDPFQDHYLTNKPIFSTIKVNQILLNG